MHKSRLTGLLLSPSLLSAFVSFLLASLIIGITTWSHAAKGSALHDYLFGPYGLTTVLETSTNPLSAVNGIFSTPAAYNVAVIVFALFIGLLVFVFLEGLDHVAAKTINAVQEVELISDQQARRTAEHQAEIRLGLRVATLIAWIVYLIFFARVIVPACVLLARPDTGDYLFTWSNALSALISAAALWTALHVHVIFMRLLVLRPRLFSSGDSVIVGRGGHDN